MRVSLLLLCLALVAGACASGGSAGMRSARTLESVTLVLARTLTPAVARRSLGEPDEVLGSGLLILRYRLQDGTSLLLGFPGEAPIMYAKVDDGRGNLRDLPLP